MERMLIGDFQWTLCFGAMQDDVLSGIVASVELEFKFIYLFKQVVGFLRSFVHS